MISERRVLQIAVVLACVVPIAAGLGGAIYGNLFLADQRSSVLHDSQFRYLSGLLLAIGLAFISIVPNIERHSRRFRLLTILVFAGGIVRLAGVLLTGSVSNSVIFALVMELVVTPSLAIWQNALRSAHDL